MRTTTRFGIAFSLSVALVLGCGKGDVPPDEALARVRKSGYGSRADAPAEFRDLGPGTKAETWRRAAEQHYPPAELDYFADMDRMGATDAPGAHPLRLTPDGVKGRNAWAIWTAGNEAWWDWLARYGYGTIDLLKLVDPTDRGTRFARTGLVNEPGTRPPDDEETDATYGVRFARPVTPERAQKGESAHVEYRAGYGGEKWKPASTFVPSKPDTRDPYPVYGYPSGVVGLRLFPNPDFFNSAAAQKRWNANLYYEDSPRGRAYVADPNTVRPFRVGMSCGFCHIAPHPLNPPADPEKPEWANLSNNVGNQFMRIRAVFGNTLEPTNYLYHVFDSQLPGAVDTSGYPSDNNNNPNTINSFYGLRGRLDRARNNPQETISPDSLTYLRTYVPDPEEGKSPRHVPRVLLDGSDSVGVHIALSRVYLNIGTHHQQWIRVQNPLLGFRQQEPFKLRDIAENSLYWHATLLRIKPMAEFFTLATDPMRLKDAAVPKDAPDLLKAHLRGTGLPWYTAPAPGKKEEPKKEEPKKEEPKKDGAQPPDPKPEPPKAPDPKAEPAKGPAVFGAGDYAKGRAVFAKGCIACHSSVQPGDLPDLEALLPDPALPRPDSFRDKYKFDPAQPFPPGLTGEQKAELAVARRALRLTGDDRVQLARGTGGLPPRYAAWARQAVEQRTFWEYTRSEKGTDGKDQTFTIHNFLSIDERVPVTVTRTNSGRAAATNALHGHVWEDFASETYKELAPVGPVRYRDPFSGAEKTYSPPGGGPGYYRVPTLISVWATAPFLHNNALGTFNNDPSVAGRLASFDDSARRLLWPERRATPSAQWHWDGKNPAGNISDAWYPGRKSGDGAAEQSASRRAEDGGWIWRTTEESWLRFDGRHVPRLIGGGLGLSEYQTTVVAWVPALVFLILGVVLLLSDRFIRFRERYLSWLWWVLGPIWWALAVGSLVAAVGALVALVRYWDYVRLLDVATQGSIWGFRALAVLLPVVFFGSVAVLFALHRFAAERARRRAAQRAGAVCLVLAILAAVSIGPFLSGNGGGVKIGPIPEGVPINVIANINPDAPRSELLAAVDALGRFTLKHKDVKEGAPAAEKEARRIEFEQTVGPALLAASKCPDYVTDRGHDYEFIRHLTDEEKNELIALLKTF